MLLSVGAHAVLWVLFGKFHMRSPDKITLTEPFRIKRSTFDATVLDDVPDTGTNATTDAQDPSKADTDASIEEAMAMLDPPTEQEEAVVGKVRYQPHTIVLHSDTSFMPKRRSAWSSSRRRAPSSAEVATSAAKSPKSCSGRPSPAPPAA